MISPDPIHACWEGSNGFCVAGATISMPLRCSPWPYTCWLGSVKWLLCGRCSNFDASEMISPDPIHACWEVSNGFCVAGATIFDASEMISPDPIHACWEGSNGFWVAGATILMPLRWSPLTLYMLVGKGQMAFVWQVQQFSMPLRWSPLTLYMLVGKGQMAFEWQVQQFWCLWDDLPWPYTCLLGRVKWLLCGRCNNFDASEMISPDPIHACWEGSQVIDSDFVWPVQ